MISGLNLLGNIPKVGQVTPTYDLREVIKHKLEDMCFFSAIRTTYCLAEIPHIHMAPNTPNSIMSINTLS